MKVLPFTKMEGAGNDYVYVDAIRHEFAIADGPRLAKVLSDRHFGIGGDGLIVLAGSETADVRMLMWNADGSRGAMCGNGLRCLAKLAYDQGHIQSPNAVVETDAGPRPVELRFGDANTVVSVAAEMGAVQVESQPSQVEIDDVIWEFHPGDAGNPHAVIFLDQHPDRAPVHEVGQAFQRLDRFAGGVNVEFVQAQADGSVIQRTFERGSGETLACGTGAAVVGMAAMQTGLVPGPQVPVHLRGGTLFITAGSSSLVMEGPARTVFEGSIRLPEP